MAIGILQGASVELTWDKHPDLDVTGYIAYWGTTPQLGDSMDVGMVERALIDDLQANTTYYFGVRAYDRSRNLGALSQSLTFNPGTLSIDKSKDHHPHHSTTIFPNPFSTSVSISTGHGTLVSIFDLKGQLVKQFPKTNPGIHTIIMWNGTDQKDRPLPRGIYFVRLKHGTHVHARKVFLVK
jgi:hypothetical protein